MAGVERGAVGDGAVREEREKENVEGGREEKVERDDMEGEGEEEGGEDVEGEGEEGAGGKKKRRRIRKYHETRAHANPLSDNRFPWCPISPQDMNWHTHYPAHFAQDGSKITGVWLSAMCDWG